jgi:hypothetical protein
MRTHVPTEEEFNLLLRAVSQVRRHKDVTLPLARTIFDVVSRFKLSEAGMELMLEYHHHGIQSLQSGHPGSGWFYVLPTTRSQEAGNTGSVTIYDEGQFARELLFMKMTD